MEALVLNSAQLETLRLALIGTPLHGPRGYSAYDLAVQEGFEGTIDEWLTDLEGEEVSLGINDTHIRWRLGEEPWQNLIALSALQITLQATETHVQWRLGEGAWQNLVDFETIRGPAGREVELQGTATHIQWRYDTDVAWTNLVPLSSLDATKANATLDNVSDASFGSRPFTTTGGSLSRTLAERTSSEVRLKDFATAVNANTNAQVGFDAALTLTLPASTPHKKLNLESGLIGYTGSLLIDSRRNLHWYGSGWWTIDGGTQFYANPVEGSAYGIKLKSPYGHYFGDMVFRMRTGADALFDIGADPIPSLSGVGVTFERVSFNPIVGTSNGAALATLVVSEFKQLQLKHVFFSPNKDRPVLQLGRSFGSAPGSYMNGQTTLARMDQSYFFGDVVVHNMSQGVFDLCQFPANSSIVSPTADHEGSCISIRCNGLADEDHADATLATNPDTITITRDGAVATVYTSKRHRLRIGDYCRVVGADQTEYNGRKTVTGVIDPNTFTFTVTGTPATPATGVDEVHFGVPAIQTSFSPGTSNIARGGCYEIVCNDIRDRLVAMHLSGYGISVRTNNVGARHDGGEEIGIIVDVDADGIQIDCTNDFYRCWAHGNIAVLDRRTSLKDQFIYDATLTNSFAMTVNASETWTQVVSGVTRRPLKGGKYTAKGGIRIGNSATAGAYRGRIIITDDAAVVHEIDISRLTLNANYQGSIMFDRDFILPGTVNPAAIALELWQETGAAGAGAGGTVRGTDARFGRSYLTLEELP